LGEKRAQFFGNFLNPIFLTEEGVFLTLGTLLVGRSFEGGFGHGFLERPVRF